MKSLSATMPTDERWATRLEKLLAGGFSETVLEATVFGPDGTELFRCPGVLEVEKGQWLLRLFRKKAKKGLEHLTLSEIPDGAVYARSDCLRAVLQFPDHTEAVLEEVRPTQSSQSASDSCYDETRHRARMLTKPLRKNPICALHPEDKWTESLIHGFIPGVRLPYSMRGGAKSTLELPVIGERSHSRTVWTAKRDGWEWLAVDDDRGLAIYLKEDSGVLPKEARENFHALTLALGYVMGRQLRCCYTAVDWCGKEMEGRELSPPEGSGGTILLPIDSRFAERNHEWTINLVSAAYDFLKNQELPIVRLATNCMLQVYRSAHPVVPTDTKMLVLCTRLEKLVKVLYESAKTISGTDKGKKKTHCEGVRRVDIWKHASDLLDISWENGISLVYQSWEECRHDLAHGDPEVFASMPGEAAFRHMFRLEGGFNALLAGIFRCHTSIRISPMEPHLSANVRQRIETLGDQEWKRRVVATLNAVTPEMAGYQVEDESEG